ncbi:MAG: hypothetical protein ACREJ2_03445 [Planctomycetota bacterium]
MKLHRLVIAFIVLSGSALLIAGAYFPKPTFPTLPTSAALTPTGPGAAGGAGAEVAQIAAKP